MSVTDKRNIDEIPKFYFYDQKIKWGGPLLTLMQYMYGEDECKMSGYKTTYSTDEKQLYIPRKFSNLSEPSLRSCSQNISNFLGM